VGDRRLIPIVEAGQDPKAPDMDTVALLKQRDQNGLRQLLETYGPKVKWYLRAEFKKSLDDAGVQDALNQAAFRAWRFIDSFDPSKGTLRGWFYKIARNAALKILQQQNAERAHVQVEDWDLASFLALHTPEDHEPTPRHKRFLKDLWNCIGKLSPLQKGIILADLKAGGDVADAGDLAAAFHTSKNSIYASRSLARKALREGLILLGHVPGDTPGAAEHKHKRKREHKGDSQAEVAQ